MEGTATRRQPPFRNAGPGSFAAAGGEPAAKASFAIGSESWPLALRAAARAPHVRPFRGECGFRASSTVQQNCANGDVAVRAVRNARVLAASAALRCEALRVREDPTGSTAPGAFLRAAKIVYDRSVTRAAERFRLKTAGGDDRGRGCDAEARAAPDAAIGPGRAGSRARAAG